MPASSASARSRRACAGAAVLLAAAALAGACGDDDGSPPNDGGAAEQDQVIDISGTEPVGEVTAGSVAPLVQCRDWNAANAKEKLATIADVRSQINLEETGIEAPPLSDEEAGDVFDNACKEAYAQGFRLYKLYARAAGFAPLARQLREP